MRLSTVPQAAIDELRAALGDHNLRTDPADCLPYGYDNSRRVALPAAMGFATSQAQIVSVVQTCNSHRIPLTVRGRGTNTTGAAVPISGGLVLSLERMNRISDIRPDDRLAIVEPGVTNGELQAAIAPLGFFWAPDPTSSDFSSIGGNLACCAAGPRAVKYGTVRENVLGLTAITGSGDVIKAGVQTTKGVVGYDFTRLLLGSEGTLGIITSATLKLTPLPETRRTLRAIYRTVTSAARAVADIMRQPDTPCALEFTDGGALNLIRAETGLPAHAQALLMIEVDGSHSSIEHSIRAIHRAAANSGLIDFTTASSPAEAQTLWAARKALSPKLRSIAPKKINEDVVVPVSQIPALVDGLQTIADNHRITIVSFGHAGNGNLHVNLLGNPDNSDELQRMQAALDAVFTLVLKLGGTLSGEHGIGLDKRDFVGREIDATTLDLMRAIRRNFDPNGILNPGKFLPLSSQDR